MRAVARAADRAGYELRPPSRRSLDEALAITIADLSYDSRQIRPGWLFCAIRGGERDGHDFSHAAREAGASALLVEHFVEVDLPQIRVPVVRAALGAVAAEIHGWPSHSLETVAITGTNGKTTTAYLLQHVLETAGRRTGLIGTIEAWVGDSHAPALLTTPEAPDLQRLLATMVHQGLEAVTIEVSSHGLDQGRVDGIEFDLGIFTNLAHEHLDYHGTMEHYYAAKAALFAPGRCHQGIVVVDDEWGQRLAWQLQSTKALPVTTVGLNTAAEWRVHSISTRLHQTRFTLEGHGESTEIEIPLAGPYNATNAAAAYLGARILGVDPRTAAAALRSGVSVAGRFQAVEMGQPFLVVIDYAHTPDALARVLATARELAAAGGSVHLVVGARGGRDRFKRQEIGRVAVSLADRVFFTADSPGLEPAASIVDQLRIGTFGVRGAEILVELDRREAIVAAIRGARHGDAVVIVGRGHEKTQHIGHETITLSDLEVVTDALANLGFSDPGSRSSPTPTRP